MDAIKKKMQSLKSETDNALSRAEELDGEAKEATLRAEKYEETVSFCATYFNSRFAISVICSQGLINLIRR